MSEYIRFARLAIVLLVLFMIGRLIVGGMGVPYESGTGIFSLVTLSYMASFFFAAFSRPLRGYSWKQAVMLGVVIVLSAQILINIAMIGSYVLGVDTYFNHPIALRTTSVPTGPLTLTQALPVRLFGLVANLISGVICATLGWWGGSLIPKTN